MGTQGKTYEGKEPYIFVSYSHKESDIVIPLIERLQSDGYRVWYDDGIIPGTEWPETIAQHLNDSAVFICFISPSYADSFNCKRELDFAVHKRKDFLAVFLEETQMPLGMEMQISTVQAMFYYKTTRDEFFRMLYESGIIKACKEGAEVPASEGEAASAKAEDVKAESAAAGTKAEEVKENVKETTDKVKEDVAKEKERLEAEYAKVQAKAKEAKKDQFHVRKKSKAGLIIGVIAAVVAVFIALVAIVGIILFAIPKNPYKGVTDVVVADEVINDKMLKQILSDDSLVTLRLENCSFEIVDETLWQTKMSDGVESIELVNCKLTDSDMNTIFNGTVQPAKIDISNNAGITKLDFLANASANLKELNISHTGISDLSKVKRTNVEILYAEGNGISDINCLSGMSSLQEIYVAHNQISEFEKDVDFNSLRVLDISGNKLGNLNFLKTAIHLEVIKADENSISSIKGLENCTLLYSVSLANNSIMSVAVLETSKDTIRELNLSHNTVSKIEYSMPALEKVNIDNNNFRYLGFLTEANNLEYLSAEHNRIDSILEIGDKSSLKVLNLSYNELSDVVDISGLEHLEDCYLDHNDIITVNVKGAEFIALNNNGNLETIAGADPTFVLKVALTFDSKHQDLINAPFCREIYVQDVPLDQQVAYETIWGDSIIFNDKEGMEALIGGRKGEKITF